ncbi:HAMP domain-containing sensor histidine kinase [Proteinivorax tanatarense]|uniref:histidine kinase n=1 Tax=Proteinivorax tanatarense TaxID=1260629 RepID=A0AAU7VJ08_9FIRM
MGVLIAGQSQFFDSFYKSQKVNNLENSAKVLEEEISEYGLQSRETQELLSVVTDNINGDVFVLDFDGNMLAGESNMMMGHRINIPRKEFEEATTGEIVWYQSNVGHQRHNNVEMIGVLVPSTSYIYFFQTPLQPIEEAIYIAQKFTMYTMLIALVVSIILAWMFSKNLTTPLFKINSQAQSIARLDFDERWEDSRGDEIGQLGQTLNTINDELKMTIDKLETELAKEKSIDKMRKELVARISHELQTPLSLIKGYIEALEDDIYESESERQNYYQIIQQESDKMSKLVKEMVNLGVLESQKVKLDIQKVDLHSLIQKNIDKFAIEAKKEDIALKYDGQKQVKAMCDEYRIDQVLTNFLDNAMKNVPVGGEIKVAVKKEDQRVKVSVFNQGKHIKEQQLQHIWESFNKGEKSKGTGLGLSIAQNILKLHKSNFGVENVEGGGVVFYFDLPDSL